MSRGLLGKIFGGGGRAAGEPVVGLAGKHPAWPDHIRGHGYLGRADATLEGAASAFYRALEKVVDSGAWGSSKASVPAGVIPYGHEMLWLVRAGKAEVLIAGRVWPGRDQAGREQYPMIGWALLPGWSVERAAAALPVLESLEQRVRGAAARDEVEAAVANAERILQGLPPAADSGAEVDAANLAELFAPAVDERERLLARMSRDAAFLATQGGGAGGGRNGDGGAAVAVRVATARGSRDDLASLLRLAAGVMPGADVLVVSAHGRMYLDLIAHTALRANELVQIRRDETVIVPVQREQR